MNASYSRTAARFIAISDAEFAPGSPLRQQDTVVLRLPLRRAFQLDLTRRPAGRQSGESTRTCEQTGANVSVNRLLNKVDHLIIRTVALEIHGCVMDGRYVFFF